LRLCACGSVRQLTPRPRGKSKAYNADSVGTPRRYTPSCARPIRRTPQRRDQATHLGRQHLTQRGRRRPPGRRDPARIKRLMDCPVCPLCDTGKPSRRLTWPGSVQTGLFRKYCPGRAITIILTALVVLSTIVRWHEPRFVPSPTGPMPAVNAP
jgi:hypothetical protein